MLSGSPRQSVRKRTEPRCGRHHAQMLAAIATGAGFGIGRTLAIQLTETGARIAVSDIQRAGLDATLKMSTGNSRGKSGAAGRRCFGTTMWRFQIP